MTTVFAAFDFEAAHFLPNVPDGHKCKRVHGHNWRVEIYCKGEVQQPQGWVIDFFDIERAWKEIYAASLDHQLLNAVVGLENPTSENVARWIWERMSTLPLSRVVVKETTSFGAIYEGGA